MKYSIRLNLDLNPFAEGIDISSYRKIYHNRIPLKDLNPELHNFFNKRNLKILLAELFYIPPNRVSLIHTDLSGGDYTKLNWIFKGTNSFMCWYKENTVRSSNIQKTFIGTDYISFRPSEVSLIAKEAIESPSLVQVGIPHNIINDNEDRHCLSIVFLDSNSNRLTMNESLAVFNDLVDRAGFEPA